VRVIYNFVDTERFRPERCSFLRRKLAAEDEKVLIHLSNFRPVKRVTDIVRAFALIAHRVKSRLLLVGTGPDRTEAERLTVELEIADHVNFLGPMNDVSPVLSIADLFLMASEQESFGLASLEAMSCQVPVIATRIGGLPELVVDGETGYLVPLGDVEAMAARARELLTDEDRRRTMAGNARQRAIEQFNTDRIVSQYEDYYREVIHRSGLGW
jgi:N-acetyl-alpha-D-glucosaminyl L-malate synthase BshA